MSDMSAGQIVGGIVGGVIGFFYFGGAAVQGFAIGAGIGGYIDPPPGPNLKGPTLDDKSFQSSSYGVPLPRLYGTIATMGNIIWLENNEYKSVTKKEQQGGKGGGGGATVETTTYYATFAIALAEALPGSAVRRIWAGGKLIYSASGNDLGSLIQSQNNQAGWRYYDGSQVDPDSRMEASMGVGSCPSYEGTAYIIFYDFDLTNYGNGLAGCPIKAELVCSSNTGLNEYIITGTYDSPPNSDMSVGCTGVFLSGDNFDFMPAFWPGLYESASTYSGNIVSGKVAYRIASFPHDDDIYTGQRVRVYKGCNTKSTGWISYLKTSDDEERIHLVSLNPSIDIPLGKTNDFFDQQIGHVVHVIGGMGASYFSRSGPLTPRLYYVFVRGHGYIYVSKDTFPAFGFTDDGLIVIVDPDDSSPGIHLRDIAIYDGLSLVKSFQVELPLVDATYSVLVTGKIINLFSQANKDGVAFWRIDIDSEEILSYGNVVFDFDDFVTGGSGVFNNTLMGNLGNLFCVAAPREDGGSRFVYFNLNSSGTSVIAPAALDEIVSECFIKAGVNDFDVSDLNGIAVDGYRIDGVMSARAAISALQIQNIFDVLERGYSIFCVKRGSMPTVSISRNNMLLNENSIVNTDRISESVLPSAYKLNYIDYNREYDSSEQEALYPSNHNNIRQEQLAIVMSAEKAAKLADVLCGLSWVERDSFSFSLPQTFLQLRVSDIVAAEVYPGVYRELRINDIANGQNQTVSISAKASDYSVYESSAAGIDVDPPSEIIPYLGQSYFYPMDIPMVLESLQDSICFVGAMYGDGEWPGGVLLSSIDSGQTYKSIGAFYGKCTVGQVVTLLNTNDCYVIDRAGSITISVLSGVFTSVTEQQMMAGKNFCAYGKDGRWEIIQYAEAVQINYQTLTISVLVRGLFGTEWAASLHEVGDHIIFLEDVDNQIINLPSSAVGVEHIYKSVTIGKNVVDVNGDAFLYNAANLRPLSVVNVSGSRDIDGNLDASFFYRSRYVGNFWVTGIQPINEPNLLFEIDVLDGLNILRTINSSTGSFLYSAASQIEDFGSSQSSISFKIYQISASVGRGYPASVTL